MRSRPLPRGSGFKRGGVAAGVRAKRSTIRYEALAQPARAAIKPIADTCTSQPKENAVYSKAYRQLVAALPCIYCGRQGMSQAAHPPPTGKGRKEDDRECFPLCCVEVLRNGCHVEFDNYRLIPTDLMRAQAEQWGAQTRAKILAAGDWPARLPKFQPKDAVAHALRALSAIKSGA